MDGTKYNLCCLFSSLNILEKLYIFGGDGSFLNEGFKVDDTFPDFPPEDKHRDRPYLCRLYEGQRFKKFIKRS